MNTELLLSQIPPFKLQNKDFISCFEGLLQDAEHLKIASGYVSADALAELKKIIEENKKPFLELLIGMHYFEGFSRIQYDAAVYLDDYLRATKLGSVSVATVFKFHGKMYSFSKDKIPFAGMVGSSNLDCILQKHNNFEADILLQNADILGQVDSLITDLCTRAGTPISEVRDIKIIEKNTLLDNHYMVSAVNEQELVSIWSKRTDIVFHLPVKGDEAPGSNLNVYFGRGRVNEKGFVKPRHWYEVELIVPISITSHKRYPKAGYPGKENVITVYTDDGWKFKCKISGQNSKNFRSEDDLKILGKWIKGRLENSGSLKIGLPATDDVLKHYGRDAVDLIATDNPQIWLLNFGVKNEAS